MKPFLEILAEGHHLTRQEASAAMRLIMGGEATDAQIAAFLMALRIKGEHPDELLGFIDVMRDMSVHISVDDPDTIDLCGTGGDGSGTFNISTVAAFVAAGAGATVAKHGNRSVSSSCGSADVMAELGIPVSLHPDRVARAINTIGIGFLFAPLFHPAVRHAARPRMELGMKTAFNLLGPMANPAGVRRQLVGAFSEEAASVMSVVYQSLPVDLVYVVHSTDGLDEISLGGTTNVFEIRKNSRSESTISPEHFGLPAAGRQSLRGGTAHENATTALRILGGEKTPQRSVVAANAAMALMASGRASTITEGVGLAEESIDSGRALGKLHQLQAFAAS
jgi:anthranilate phosphoribosyltransferase